LIALGHVHHRRQGQRPSLIVYFAFGDGVPAVTKFSKYRVRNKVPKGSLVFLHTLVTIRYDNEILIVCSKAERVS